MSSAAISQARTPRKARAAAAGVAFSKATFPSLRVAVSSGTRGGKVNRFQAWGPTVKSKVRPRPLGIGAPGQQDEHEHPRGRAGSPDPPSPAGGQPRQQHHPAGSGGGGEAQQERSLDHRVVLLQVDPGHQQGHKGLWSERADEHGRGDFRQA